MANLAATALEKFKVSFEKIEIPQEQIDTVVNDFLSGPFVDEDKKSFWDKKYKEMCFKHANIKNILIFSTLALTVHDQVSFDELLSAFPTDGFTIENAEFYQALILHLKYDPDSKSRFCFIQGLKPGVFETRMEELYNKVTSVTANNI